MNNLYNSLSPENKKRADDYIYALAVGQIPTEDERLSECETEAIEEYLKGKTE